MANRINFHRPLMRRHKPRTAALLAAAVVGAIASDHSAWASTPTDVSLQVNVSNGQVTLISAIAAPNAVITSYLVTSNNSLQPFPNDGYRLFGNSFENNPNVYYTASNGSTYNNWSWVKNTVGVIGEGYPPHIDLNHDTTWTNYTLPSGGYALGQLFKPLANGGVEDLSLDWTDADLTDFIVPVHYLTTANTKWNGSGADSNWQTGANWTRSGGSSGARVNDALIFTGGTTTTANNDFPANSSFTSITFDANAGTFTLTGNALQNTSIYNNSTHRQTISLPLIYTTGGALSTSSGGGDLVVGSLTLPAGSGFLITGSGTTSITKPIQCQITTRFNLSASGGMLSLDCANALATGTLSVYNGTLIQSVDNALTGNMLLDVTGGTAILAHANTTLSTSSAVYVEKGGTLLLGNSAAFGAGQFSVLNSTSFDNISNGTLQMPSNYTLGGRVNFIGTHDLTLSGRGTLASPLTTNVLSHTLTLGSVSAVGVQLTKTGTGTLVLSGPLSAPGRSTVSVNDGVLALNNAQALGSSPSQNSLILNGGKIDNTTASPIQMTGISTTVWNNDFVYGGTNDLDFGTAAINLQAANGFSVTVTTNGTHALKLGGVISDYAGGFSTATQLVKAGPGTLILSGGETINTSKSFTGGTSVLAGTLLVNNTTGSGLGDGDVGVSGGVLGGTGKIAGNVTAGQLGTIAPGVPGSIGTLTTGNVMLANGATLSIQLNSNTITADRLSSTSAVSLGDVAYANLSVADIGNTRLPLGDSFPIVTAATGVTGIFAGLTEGSQFTVGQNVYAISYTTPDEVVLTTVPEPASSLGVALLGMGILRRRRRLVRMEG